MPATMPQMRGIGVPVNDYYVHDFVDIPEFRYNKIPLEKVTKDKDGFYLQLDDADHPEYFVSRENVEPPKSGGNTMNAFL
ncbi:MAG: hypothetical protein P8Y12_08620, partial [Gammaproteobacteria bacterium]